MTPGTTIPAALVGVWEGARVWMDDSDLDTDHGVVNFPATDGRWWATFPRHRLSAAGPDHREIGLSRMHLDLTHRQTRLEAMARLALRVCPDAGFSGATFEHDPRSFDWRVWCIRAPRSHLNPNWTTEAWGREKAPALADLDPTDDTRLPDGTRVVDVRALAIVCQHVFGGAS